MKAFETNADGTLVRPFSPELDNPASPKEVEDHVMKSGKAGKKYMVDVWIDLPGSGGRVQTRMLVDHGKLFRIYFRNGRRLEPAQWNELHETGLRDLKSAQRTKVPPAKKPAQNPVPAPPPPMKRESEAGWEEWPKHKRADWLSRLVITAVLTLLFVAVVYALNGIHPVKHAAEKTAANGASGSVTVSPALVPAPPAPAPQRISIAGIDPTPSTETSEYSGKGGAKDGSDIVIPSPIASARPSEEAKQTASAGTGTETANPAATASAVTAASATTVTTSANGRMCATDHRGAVQASACCDPMTSGRVRCKGFFINSSEQTGFLQLRDFSEARDNQGYSTRISIADERFGTNWGDDLLPATPENFALTYIDESDGTATSVTLTIGYYWNNQRGVFTIPNVPINR